MNTVLQNQIREVPEYIAVNPKPDPFEGMYI